jgi:hypothetical protein
MATYPLTWLASVLREAGCTVVEHGDWKHHGRDGSFSPKAIMLHHDASPAGETSHGWEVIYYGREGLEGPLSQLWLDYDGRWHVIAAGRANHAGEGRSWGVVAADQGNRDAIGIETDHTSDEKWTDAQRSEGLRGVHALAKRLGITTSAEIDRAVLAHTEYAPDRKIDPDPMNMDTARAKLASYEEDSMPTADEVAAAVWRYDQNGAALQAWAYQRDVAQHTAGGVWRYDQDGATPQAWYFQKNAALASTSSATQAMVWRGLTVVALLAAIAAVVIASAR